LIIALGTGVVFLGTSLTEGSTIGLGGEGVRGGEGGTGAGGLGINGLGGTKEADASSKTCTSSFSSSQLGRKPKKPAVAISTACPRRELIKNFDSFFVNPNIT
jgi:hypothetical protein